MDFNHTYFAKKLFEGIGRSSVKKLPITKYIRGILKTATCLICKSSFEVYLFYAAFSLAYHCFMRVGEFTFSNTCQATQIIRNKNVSVIFDAKAYLHFIKLTIPCFYTDQKVVVVYIKQSYDSKICPVCTAEDTWHCVKMLLISFLFTQMEVH